MKLLKEINDTLESIDDSAIEIQNKSNPAEIVGAVSAFAPLLILVLTFVKVFTGDKADRKIDKAITALQLISIIK